MNVIPNGRNPIPFCVLQELCIHNNLLLVNTLKKHLYQQFNPMQYGASHSLHAALVFFTKLVIMYILKLIFIKFHGVISLVFYFLAPDYQSEVQVSIHDLSFFLINILTTLVILVVYRFKI